MDNIIICPHCGNETIQEVIYFTEAMDQGYSTISPYDIIEYTSNYYIAKCKTCKCISLFSDTEFHENQGDLREAFICYPQQKNLDDDIPEVIIQTYRRAKRIQAIESTAFAVMIRRGLEFICKDKKATGNTLKEQLEDLSKNSIIPKNLAEMGDILRFLGNIGAHATTYELDKTEVQALDDFFIAMLEYVYIAPAKIYRLRESIKN